MGRKGREPELIYHKALDHVMELRGWQISRMILFQAVGVRLQKDGLSSFVMIHLAQNGKVSLAAKVQNNRG